MRWASDETTAKRDIFVRLQEVKGDPDALLAIADGVLMRTDDDIVKGVFKHLDGVGPEHLAVSIEHAALLLRFDHVQTLARELRIERDHLDAAVAYVKTKNEDAAAKLAELL